MKLITGPLGGGWLRDCLAQCEDSCEQVKIAMAYATRDNMELLDACIRHGKPINFYGRYDETVPIDPHILRWFLQRDSLDVRYRVVPDYLHAKVIWWVDAGAYIGSANLTGRAWNTNFEAGTYFDRSELIDLGLDEQLATFFERLDFQSKELTAEVVEEQANLEKKRNVRWKQEEADKEEFAKTRIIPKGTHPSIISTNSADSRQFEEFLDEWSRTLEVMRMIARRVSTDEFRPIWIPKDVPGGAQADQFLHAFYYQRVKHGIHYPVEDFFHQNAKRPEAALQDALIWWREGKGYSHDQELVMLTDWAPTIQRIFSSENVARLTEEDWVAAASRVHAIRDYAGKQSSNGELPALSEEKIEAHCRALWRRRSERGHTVRDLLDFVIWGEGDVAERIWRGHRPGERWRIPGIGKSALGEIVGWARPDKYPPRNKRTSKGLRALGYDVKV